MPFKKENKFIPLVKIADQKSNKNGLESKIFDCYKGYYVGEWKNNKKHGKGGRVCKNQTVLYEGDFHENYRHGYGVQSIRACNGIDWVLEYRGMWYKGFRHGKGVRKYKDGRYYEGEFVFNKRIGIGHMWWPDGKYYCGEWKNGLFDGIGILIYANCNRYEGNFSHGLKHGEGVYYHIDKGQEVRGIWVEDLPRCVCITDLEYRQTSVQSTKYPIPKIGVQTPDRILKRSMNYLRQHYLLRGPTDLNISASEITKSWSVAGDAEVIALSSHRNSGKGAKFVVYEKPSLSGTRCTCGTNTGTKSVTISTNPKKSKVKNIKKKETKSIKAVQSKVYDTTLLYRRFHPKRPKCYPPKKTVVIIESECGG